MLIINNSVLIIIDSIDFIDFIDFKFIKQFSKNKIILEIFIVCFSVNTTINLLYFITLKWIFIK